MATAECELPSYLIVDAHSMIFAWDDLRELHDSSTIAARNELIRRMTAYQDVTAEHVVLVFDGKGETTKTNNEKDGIQVFYAPAGITADQIIERLAGKYADRRRLTVASRDRSVLDTCSSFGANAISANALYELLERSKAELHRKINTR
ncbi:MAG: NYN domain-containing protein [Verrucomicrobiales bacterium]|jgi:predicted RNA-binding protein with PIN domain